MKLIIPLIILSFILLGCDLPSQEFGVEYIPVDEICTGEACMVSDEWEYEFECDEWRETGRTLYRDTEDCETYSFLDNGTWIKEEEYRALLESRQIRKYKDNQLIDIKEFDSYGEMEGWCDGDWESYDDRYFNGRYSKPTCIIGSLLDFNGVYYRGSQEICMEEPYQEKECVHKQVVGKRRKRK
jgi:hypothetical protein